MATATRTTVTFPKKMMRKAKAKADFYGVSFPEYLRHLVFIDIKAAEPVFYLSDETEKAMIQAEKDYDEGKTKSFDNVDDVMSYILDTKA